jgi:hypothetical protein
MSEKLRSSAEKPQSEKILMTLLFSLTLFALLRTCSSSSMDLDDVDSTTFVDSFDRERLDPAIIEACLADLQSCETEIDAN